MGIDVATSEIGMQLKSFGAQIRTSVSRDVTHLVVSTLRPRTSKVRQAAEIPSIKIVSQEWLSECFCKWTKADETPYLFDIHPDDRPGGRAAASVPIVVETDTDDGEDTDDRRTNGKPRRKIRLQNPKLRIVNPLGVSHKLEEDDEDSDDEDDGQIDDDDLDDEFSPFELQDGELSPTERLKGFDWGDVDDELEAFMEGSSEEDEDGGGDDDETKTDDDSHPAVSKKRKHATDDEGETGSESERVDEDGNVLTAKRARRIKSRQPLGGSSLKNQYSPDGNDDNSTSLPTPQVTGDEEDAKLATKQADQQHEEDDDFDIDEAELEADFMAEFAEEDEEETNGQDSAPAPASASIPQEPQGGSVLGGTNASGGEG